MTQNMKEYDYIEKVATILVKERPKFARAWEDKRRRAHRASRQDYIEGVISALAWVLNRVHSHPFGASHRPLGENPYEWMPEENTAMERKVLTAEIDEYFAERNK